MRSKRRVWAFFYGSFMNPGVLARVGVRPATPRRARLDGWDIEIRPHATLVPSGRRSVHGILARVTHADLHKLYAKDWFGYIAWRRGRGKPTAQYLQKMISVARQYDFPHLYIERIRSFGR